MSDIVSVPEGSTIHPSSIVDGSVSIGENVTIGPFCIIGAGATIGDGCTLKSHIVIEGRVTLGRDNIVYPFVSMGHPQDLKYAGEDTELIIGDRNTIREHATLHLGTAQAGGKTIVGDDCLLMVGIHVAHDCVVGNRVIMANNATLGGHVIVGDHVLIGGLSAVHQFIRIGSFSVIGGMSGVESDVIPYGRVKGERANLAGLNLIGLERSGVERSQVRVLQRAFNQLFGDEGTLEERLDQVDTDFADDTYVQSIVEFARGKDRFPLCSPPRKGA